MVPRTPVREPQVRAQGPPVGSLWGSSVPMSLSPPARQSQLPGRLEGRPSLYPILKGVPPVSRCLWPSPVLSLPRYCLSAGLRSKAFPRPSLDGTDHQNVSIAHAQAGRHVHHFPSGSRSSGGSSQALRVLGHSCTFGPGVGRGTVSCCGVWGEGGGAWAELLSRPLGHTEFAGLVGSEVAYSPSWIILRPPRVSSERTGWGHLIPQR